MRILSAIGVAILFALLAIFAVENIRPASYNFVGTTIPGNVWWTVAGSALLGFLIASLLWLPGRVTSGMRGRSSGRLQQELATLRAQHERTQQEYMALRGQHAQTVAERDQLRSRLAAPSATTTAPETPTSRARTAVVANDGSQSARPPVVPESERRIAPTPQTNMPQGSSIGQDASEDIGQDSRPRELLPR